MDYSNSALSLLVPLLVIVMVVLTRRVAISLISGIALGAILINDGFSNIISYVYTSITSTLYTYENGALSFNSWNLQIFGFLFILGIMTKIISHSGGIKAFILWAKRVVRTKRDSEFLAYVAGIVIFIDDYFNALTVGQISKNLIDTNKSTREKLAYIIDSTSAPVCVLVPISSWGAYTLGLLNDSAKSMGDPLTLILSSAAFNFYAWLTLICVFFVILWQVDIGAIKNAKPMQEEESSTIASGGSIFMLIVPILSLFISISALIIYSGYASSGSSNIFEILKECDTAFALFYGGLISLVITLLVSIRPSNCDFATLISLIKEGIGIMLPATLILLLAWAIGPVIRDDIKTGIYLANLSKEILVGNSVFLVPLIIFLFAGFMGFCTGTSWGTFAIMIPIALDITSSLSNNPMLSIIGISAVLAGAVYGDHTSPISDTTILSATGAGCDVRAHFITQLPYATIVATISCICFFVVTYSSSLLLAYAIGIALLIGVLFVKRQK